MTNNNRALQRPYWSSHAFLEMYQAFLRLRDKFDEDTKELSREFTSALQIKNKEVPASGQVRRLCSLFRIRGIRQSVTKVISIPHRRYELVHFVLALPLVPKSFESPRIVCGRPARKDVSTPKDNEGEVKHGYITTVGYPGPVMLYLMG